MDGLLPPWRQDRGFWKLLGGIAVAMLVFDDAAQGAQGQIARWGTAAVSRYSLQLNSLTAAV
jgi:hypothetical protein